jgi:hypothetical protein
MTAIAAAVAEAFATWPTVPRASEEETFGTVDPPAIDRLVSTFCQEHLGSAAATCLLFESHQASVFGLELRDGRRVCVKVFGPRYGRAFLDAVQFVQDRLVERGFPCPRPLLGARPLGGGSALVESLELEGDWADAHRREIRSRIAEALARLIGLTTDLALADRLDALPRSMLEVAVSPWPRPHHPMFDFEATASTAGWIDDLGRRARRRVTSAGGRDVVGHGDWSVKDMRFDGDRLAVVYDWQSLCRAPEPVLVGQAAGSFTMQWRFPAPIAPELREIEGFIDAYERGRGRPFAAEERVTARAAAAFVLAYSARCEHALDPGAVEFPTRSARDAARSFGGILVT